MGAETNTTETLGVVLVRPGGGSEDFELAEGPTLADLLRAAGADANDQDVLIGGRPLAESLPLHAGMVVSLVPRPRGAAGQDSWRKRMADPGVRQAFEEMVQAVNEKRRAEKERDVLAED